MKFLRQITPLLFLSSLLILSGCASNATSEGMGVHYSPAVQLQSKQLQHNITVDAVDGGHETNPLWASDIPNSNFKKALIDSLTSAELYQTLEKAHYTLDAQLIEIKKPLFGITLETTAKVKYTLKDKTGNIVYEQEILSNGNATFSDSPIAVQRLRLANENSAKENIRQLLDALYQVSIK